jgi:hypothetical protein
LENSEEDFVEDHSEAIVVLDSDMLDRSETPGDSDTLEYFVFEEEEAVEVGEQSRCLALAYPKSRPDQERAD